MLYCEQYLHRNLLLYRKGYTYYILNESIPDDIEIEIFYVIGIQFIEIYLHMIRNKMEMEIKENVIRNKTIVFQERGYTGYSICKYLDKHQNILPVEIFPGIFISLKEEHGIRKEDRTICFNVKNMRDRFLIIDVNNSQEGSMHKEIKMKEEEIYPSKISYPNNLGGGKCRGCEVINFFSKLLSSGTYKIIKEADIVEQTKLEPYFINLCKKSLCYQNYCNIVNNGYKTELPVNEMIKIDKENDKYIPKEGKHRICAMKRYNYSKKIPARITYGGTTVSYVKVCYEPSDDDLLEYYKCYNYYGLDRKEVLKYLSDSSQVLCKIIIERIIKKEIPNGEFN